MSLSKLVDTVCAHYKKEGRANLPWRKTHDPYRIMVSEFMLQQTQVSRVEGKYKMFIQMFPTVGALARAPLSEVLRVWQGLGYNRRAKFLHLAAKEIVQVYKGKLPADPSLIETLPGIGHYTARAIAIFAFNMPEVCIETNIRTVFTHLCFPKKTNISDTQLLPLIATSLSLAKQKGYTPREWYSALMDYGVFLKKNGIRINHKSAHYTKQTSFRGSPRQLRGAIVRTLLDGPATPSKLSKALLRDTPEVLKQLASLQKEGLVEARGAQFFLSRGSA